MFGIKNLRKPRELSQPNQLDMVGERGFEPPTPAPKEPGDKFEITHGNHPRSTRLARIFQCLAVPRQPLKLLETLEI